MKSLAQKLHIKAGYRVLVMHAPDNYAELLGESLEGVDLEYFPEGKYDLVHLFVKNRQVVDTDAPIALQALKEDGLLWVSYPKGSSSLQSDINRDSGWDVLNSAGWQVVSVVSVDDDWSAMRFRQKD